MKKLLCLLLVLCILFCVGCASTQGGDETTATPNGGETTADPNGEETSFDLESYTPKWHLSGTTSDLYISRKPRAIKIPKTVYEEDINGFHFHVDFFETIYPEGSKMQYRATITNNSGSAVRYHEKSAIGVIYGNGQTEYFKMVTPNISHLTDDDGRWIDLNEGETVVFEGALRSPAVEPGKYTFEIRLVNTNPLFRHAIFYCYIDVIELD